MKYGQRSIIELSVFDEDGKFITRLNSLKKSELYINSDRPHLYIKDALLDTSLLKLIGRTEETTATDYEDELNSSKSVTTIIFGKRSSVKCKLIGKGHMRSSETHTDINFSFEVPNAELTCDFELNYAADDDPSEYDAFFTAKPFNEDGDSIKLHIFEESEMDRIAKNIAAMSFIRQSLK